MMDFNHLSDEEISYELALRHIVNVGSMTHRNKVLRLEALIHEEFLKDVTHTGSDHVMSPTVNIETCSVRINELRSLVDNALTSGNTQDLSILQSRLSHYRSRLAIIQPPGFLVETLKSLSEIVNALLTSVNGDRSSRVNSSSNSGSGAIPKSTRREHNIGNHSQDSELEDDGAGANADTSEKLDRSEGRQSTLPTASSSMLAGRGRGRGVAQSQIPQRGHHVDAEADNRHRNNEDEGYAASTDQYHQIRDELLNNLLRLQLQQPRRERNVERLDDRRMQKAIHNWPFRFRGEKETKSLNIFIDRVESFAKSEEVPDDILLASIKHLLQDDALDWYARMMSQDMLTSWERFKQEIRREYLPAQYGQLLKAEAFFRYQGQTESFAKFYRDIAALFRFVEPAMAEEEKFFIAKKNMNADYAAIVTAARPRSLKEMVEVCTSYDETRMLLDRQRRIPIPHSALLEPSFATPSTASRANVAAHMPLRNGRVYAVEREEDCGAIQAPSAAVEARDEDDENWQMKIDQLIDQV